MARGPLKLFVLLVLFVPSHPGWAQTAEPATLFQTTYALEYYYPKDTDHRNLQTVFANVLFGKVFINELHYTLAAGVTSTFAGGSATNPREESGDQVPTQVWGIGPMVSARGDLLRGGGLYLAGDFSFGLLLYTQHFPPGGDFYNFATKFGVTGGLTLDPTYDLCLGLRMMHVSNGKGLGNFNPTYEGLGVNLELLVSR